DNPSEERTTNNNSSRKSHWSWYRFLLVAVPTLIPVVYFYLSGKEKWKLTDLAVIGGMFVGYWVLVLVIAARVLRNRHAQSITLASPLIEVPLSEEIRNRLVRFADNRNQKLAVVAFELLDQEIPRFEQEDERDRARRDNEHLRQQAGQGAFLVAVTTEILKRLLLLSGAQEEDRKVWRMHISETAARIVSNALDHRQALAE
ncbi:MAG: hypothetical protein JNK38_28340, partial [Acidobacteria bacterium]|nr:hypothetical protein [Acidobacteriota bacterium]